MGRPGSPRAPAAPDRSRTHVHAFDRDRYTSTVELNGQAVLLIDDMWTTGANAQSAAAALKHAGSGPVAAIVIGRHLNREWGQNVDRIGLATAI